MIGADDVERQFNRQIGHMTADGSVDTRSSPAANSVNQLVNLVLLNYMALNGEPDLFNEFDRLFPNHGLGSNLANYVKFNALDNS